LGNQSGRPLSSVKVDRSVEGRIAARHVAEQPFDEGDRHPTVRCPDDELGVLDVLGDLGRCLTGLVRFPVARGDDR
jgi:hypothetical protein